MKTGVQLLGSCRRLLRAVSMIEKYGDGSRMVSEPARLRLVGRQCSRTVVVPAIQDFSAVSCFDSVV